MAGGTKDLGKVGLTTGFFNSEQDRINNIILVNADPNGVVTATKGTLAIDLDTPSIWQNTDGTNAWIAAGGGDVVLGPAPDGDYGNDGNPNHTLTGVAEGDSLESAIDKILDYLEIIKSVPPALLSTTTLIIPDLYTAREQNSGTQITTVISNSTPTVTLDAKFGDSKNGTVTALITGAQVGQHILTNSGNDGTYGDLILSGEEVFNDIYKQILAVIVTSTPLAGNNIPQVYRLEHDTESTESTCYFDDPTPPTITPISIVGNHTGTVTYISGVPALDTGDQLLTTFDVDNAVSWYYNSIAIARIEGAVITNINVPLPVTAPMRGATVTTTSFATTVVSSRYTENPTLTYKANNSRANTPEAIGTDITTIVTPSVPVRIDSISNELLRVKSGIGQYPSVGTGVGEAGDVYNSLESLITAGNEELQLLGGNFRWPLGDYTSNLPNAGPNYSGIGGGTHNSLRWATFDLGNVTNVNSITFQYISPVGFSSIINESNVEIYLIVEGGTGWLNCNSAYPGSGSPSSNGDPAVDVGSSTSSTKRITFGPTPRTGRVLVRIGMNVATSGSKSFQDIVKV